MLSLESITKTTQDWLFAKFSPEIALTIECVIVILLCITLFAVLGLVLVLLERKVAARIQIRLGPNRVGPGGIFQTAADTLKLIMKEGLTPDSADKFLFNLRLLFAIFILHKLPYFLRRSYNIFAKLFFISKIFELFVNTFNLSILDNVGFCSSA